MSTKHTPGPWEIRYKHSQDQISPVSDKETFICGMGIWERDHKAEQHANAKLIAVAPEMLMGLEQLLIGIKNSSDPGMVYYVNGIEKLIEKATS